MTMRHSLFFGLIMYIGCAPFPLRADQTLVPFEAFYPLEGTNISYRVPAPLAKAVTNLQEWKELWREIEMHSSAEDEENDGLREPPRINVRDYTVLVIAAGSRPSGGYSVGFHSVREYESHIDVTAYELRPFGKECVVTTAITYPVAFALIPRTGKSVRFQTEHADLTCGP
jgi:PrcB C-terminal